MASNFHADFLYGDNGNEYEPDLAVFYNRPLEHTALHLFAFGSARGIESEEVRQDMKKREPETVRGRFTNCSRPASRALLRYYDSCSSRQPVMPSVLIRRIMLDWLIPNASPALRVLPCFSSAAVILSRSNS